MKEKERGKREKENMPALHVIVVFGLKQEKVLPLFLTYILGDILRGSHRYTEGTSMFEIPVIREVYTEAPVPPSWSALRWDF